MANANQISFMAACKQFFGLLPGQTSLEFGQEVKKLTQEDRDEMRPQLEKILGVEIQK